MNQQHLEDLQNQSNQILQNNIELNSYLHSDIFLDLNVLSYKIGVLRMQTVKLYDYFEFVKKHINDQNKGGSVST